MICKLSNKKRGTMLDNFLLNLDLKKEAEEILKPYQNKIKTFNVDYVGYREFFIDGTSIAFCTNNEWYRVQSEEFLNEDMAIHYAQELLSLQKTGYHYMIRSLSTVNNRFLKTLVACDMCNSLIIYRKFPNVIRLYSFIFSKNNLTSLNLFVNKAKEFEKIIDLYQDDIAELCQKPKYRSLYTSLFSKKVAQSIFEAVSLTTNEEVMCEKYNLTLKEKECISILIENGSDKDIARKINISPRTAERHVANIMKKLQVNNRLDICDVLKLKTIIKE